jgi:lipopolysaccharide/colanic/teichoic acid biosynthesis glycosyltransferase
MALSQEPRGATRSFQIVAKRLFDIIIAATVLIVISPLFLLASLAIKLGSRGPVFSGQIEYCYNNQKIKIFKFRCSTFGGLPTHTGRFLFQSGLDRLPMLINVLRGEMSIVGPCSYIAPPSLPPAEHLSDALRRSTLRPGIFGWAQIHFSQDRDAQSDMRQQITHDLFYIVNWSLLLDAKIILMSVFPKRAR